MLHSVHRLWIDGKTNVITDTGSRAGWVDKVARHVALPVQSILETIRELFTAPEQLAQKVKERSKELNNKPWEPVPQDAVELQYIPLEQSGNERRKTTNNKTSSYSHFDEGTTCTDWEPSAPLEQPGAGSSSHGKKGKSASQDNADEFKGEDAKQTIPPYQKKAYDGGYPTLQAPQPLRPSSSLLVRDEMSDISSEVFLNPSQDAGTQHDTEYVDAGTQDEAHLNTSRLFSEVDDRRDDYKRTRIQSLSLASFGSDAGVDFFEVCGGSEVLSEVARATKLSVLPGATKHPVHAESRSWDLAKGSEISKVKKLIKEERPFHTHLSPECRIFSKAYHPAHDERLDEEFWNDTMLAEGIAELAHFIHKQGLYACIEIPKGAKRFWKLERIMELGQLPGWFFIDLDGCMYNMTHPVTKRFVQKSWRYLTNAWYLVPLGVTCDKSHEHTPLEATWTKWSQAYPRKLCQDYVRLVRDGRTSLEQHR